MFDIFNMSLFCVEGRVGMFLDDFKIESRPRGKEVFSRALIRVYLAEKHSTQCQNVAKSLLFVIIYA